MWQDCFRTLDPCVWGNYTRTCLKLEFLHLMLFLCARVVSRVNFARVEILVPLLR